VRDPRRAVLGERLGRVLEHVVPGRGGGRRHRRRQVDEPARVDRAPAHDLQGARGVLLTRAADPLARDVVQVELRPSDRSRDQRAHRLVVVRSAGTETSSRSGQRSAVRRPPKTQPVSMLIVLLTHSGSATGVWP
jgi:hypothetical protein